MYWSDWGDKTKIEKAGMDGSNRKVLIGKDLKWPNGLAIDFQRKKLYWVDGGTHKIEYCDFNGKGRTTLKIEREFIAVARIYVQLNFVLS